MWTESLSYSIHASSRHIGAIPYRISAYVQLRWILLTHIDVHTFIAFRLQNIFKNTPRCLLLSVRSFLSLNFSLRSSTIQLFHLYFILEHRNIDLSPPPLINDQWLHNPALPHTDPIKYRSILWSVTSLPSLIHKYIPAPPLTDSISIQTVLPRVFFGGRILGRNWDKSLKSFPHCYSQSPVLMDFTPPPLKKTF